MTVPRPTSQVAREEGEVSDYDIDGAVLSLKPERFLHGLNVAGNIGSLPESPYLLCKKCIAVNCNQMLQNKLVYNRHFTSHPIYIVSEGDVVNLGPWRVIIFI